MVWRPMAVRQKMSRRLRRHAEQRSARHRPRACRARAVWQQPLRCRVPSDRTTGSAWRNIVPDRAYRDRGAHAAIGYGNTIPRRSFLSHGATCQLPIRKPAQGLERSVSVAQCVGDCEKKGNGSMADEAPKADKPETEAEQDKIKAAEQQARKDARRQER